ncbi:MAG: hypothetical protein Kow0089_13350 [Desulfobulbaceae bacterium]
MKPAAGKKRILLLYFSFSSQTNNLVQALSAGLEEEGVEVVRERLTPLRPLRFPIGSISGTLWMMVVTFFRMRYPIEDLSSACFEKYDLTILAGPTWSYNPSGPVLSLLDRDGDRLFKDREVLPLISCRGYWRMHWWGLKRLLKSHGARVSNLIVFSHPNPEPWRTIGVFLKLAGKIPEKKSWLRKKYRKYGHTRAQIEEAGRFGHLIGEELRRGGTDMGGLDFATPVARP